MQLVAYGAQDIYLTGNPQITFFKVVYRRHTNFSMEAIEQTFNGGTGAGQSVTATISRNGDLVHRLYVTSTSPGVTNGSSIVKECELEIGGQRIDKHYTEWMQVWNELSTSESQAIGLKTMQGDIGLSGIGGINLVQVPLQFWFCRNPGLALPLIALQYHEVKVKITLGQADSGADLAQLWADYIYLDTDERRRFAQVSHEYLIEQLQRDTYESGPGSKKLNFNHPVKELIWVPQGTDSALAKYKIKLNGHDRFAEQPYEYFSLRQPYDYHTAIPRQNLPIASRRFTGLSNTGSRFVNSAIEQYSQKGQRAGDLTNPGSMDIEDEPNIGSFYLNDTTLAVGHPTEAGATAAVIQNNVGSVFALTLANIGDDADLSGDANVSYIDRAAYWPTGPQGPVGAVNVANYDLGYNIVEGGTGAIFNGTSASNPFDFQGVTFFAEVSTATTSIYGGGNIASPFVVEYTLAAPFASPNNDRITKAVAVEPRLELDNAGNVLEHDVFSTIYQLVKPTYILQKVNDEIINESRTSKLKSKICVYSFALKPEEHQPSGTCNFSRIDNAELLLSANSDDGGGTIYAVNYNVLRIMSGMGGLAYSN